MLLVILLILVSPAMPTAEDPCQDLEAGAWHRCQPREISLGSWDPRPSPGDWQVSATVSDPPAWGTYPTERSVDALAPR